MEHESKSSALYELVLSLGVCACACVNVCVFVCEKDFMGYDSKFIALSHACEYVRRQCIYTRTVRHT